MTDLTDGVAGQALTIVDPHHHPFDRLDRQHALYTSSAAPSAGLTGLITSSLSGKPNMPAPPGTNVLADRTPAPACAMGSSAMPISGWASGRVEAITCLERLQAAGGRILGK